MNLQVTQQCGMAFSVWALIILAGCATANDKALPDVVRDPQPLRPGFNAGKAAVQEIHGRAMVFSEGEGWKVLKLGRILRAGAAVWTGARSQVGIFLGANGPVIRLESESLLVIDSLAYQRMDIETVVDTQLFLRNGHMYGNVKRLVAGSRYEVRTPKSLTNVHGTDYGIWADGKVTVFAGQVECDFDGKTYQLKKGDEFDPESKSIRVISDREYWQGLRQEISH